VGKERSYLRPGQDIAAADMIKTVLRILQYSGSSRKILLQAASIINPEFASAPWKTFEYDTRLKTVAPLKEGRSDQVIPMKVKKIKRKYFKHQQKLPEHLKT
jgi:hypothetical protein